MADVAGSDLLKILQGHSHLIGLLAKADEDQAQTLLALAESFAKLVTRVAEAEKRLEALERGFE